MISLTKLSETSTTITLGWTPVPGCIGYRFSAEKQPKFSHTFDPSRNSVKFSKGSAWYKVEALGVEDEGSYPSVAPPGWAKVADENGSFTLTENKEVRYGRNTSWNAKILGPGTYPCSNSLFGDPAVGSAKACEARPTTQQPPPPPPPPPQGLYFNGDFSTGDLSQWHDFHDAQLNRNPPGVRVVARPSGGFMARFEVIQAPDTSQWGDATVLWEGPPAYGLPYMQEGRTTWFRYRMLCPSGNNPAYPGKLTPTGGTILLIHEWHSNNGVATNAYSSFIGATFEGSPHCLIFQTRGGPGEGEMHRYHQQDGGSNRVPLKYDHWYDIVNRITFGKTTQTGSVEWIIDGVHQGSHSVPTYPSAGGGLGHEVGLYRGPSHPGTDTLYIDGVRVGPTRASVEG